MYSAKKYKIGALCLVFCLSALFLTDAFTSSSAKYRSCPEAVNHGEGKASSSVYQTRVSISQPVISVSQSVHYRTCISYICAITPHDDLLGRGPQTAEIDIGLPKSFSLSHNYPNPCGEFTIINYQLPKHMQITLRICDVTGRLVKTLVEAKQKPGYYSVGWDGRNDSGKRVSAGVYFCRLQAGDFAKTKKMVFLQ